MFNLWRRQVSIIVIICGLPGVGKTTISKDLARLINAAILSTDKIRKELLPRPTYTKQERRLIYDILTLLAKYLYNANVNCILDATFNTEYSRKKLKDKILIPSEKMYIVECSCPENITISRLKNRKNDYSDANISIYKRMKGIYEPVRGEHITVDTSQPAISNAMKIASLILKNQTNAALK